MIFLTDNFKTMTENNITILIWFQIYDDMYRMCDEEQKEKFDNLVDAVDMLYTVDDESHQSALERVYSDQVSKLPADITNTEDAVSWLNTKYDDYLFVNTLGPDEVKERIAYPDDSELSDIIHRVAGDEQMDMPDPDSLPGRIGHQIKELVNSINEVNDDARAIFDRYVTECQEAGVGVDQAKKEARSYMEGEIPAAEFVAPVALLDDLKKL